MMLIKPPTLLDNLSYADLVALQERAYKNTNPMTVGDSDYDREQKAKWYSIMEKVNERIFQIEKQLSEL